MKIRQFSNDGTKTEVNFKEYLIHEIEKILSNILQRNIFQNSI